MTTSSTEDQCLRVLEYVRKLFKDKPFYRSSKINKDDAGLHVDVVFNRATLPAEGAPKVGVVEGVRVCVLVLG